MGRNVYRHEGDDNGKVSVYNFERCRLLYRQKRPMSRRPGVFWNILLLYDTAVYGILFFMRGGEENDEVFL